MMGGSDATTIVLVGKTGNGKSATGNTILGRKAFQSKRSLSGVTSTSVMESTVMEDGHMILHVIDTPGLFDSSVDHETIGKEIVGCIKMAMDGIHALLLVFSEEEYGKNSLEEFLSDSPESLKEILDLCGNRCVLFDNKTNDLTKKVNQVQKLISCVNMVLDKKGGEPFTNEIFIEMKKWSKKVEEQNEEIRVLKETRGFSEEEVFVMMEKKRDEHLAQIFEMVELKLMNMKLKFEQDLTKELRARMRLEEDAKAARKKAEDDINRLRDDLREAKEREEEEKKKAKDDQQRQGGCLIL